jgi:hypothetical protein
MFTPSMILLMMVNTIAASGAALVALQASLLRIREPRYDRYPAEEHFFRSNVSATEVGESRSPR